MQTSSRRSDASLNGLSNVNTRRGLRNHAARRGKKKAPAAESPQMLTYTLLGVANHWFYDAATANATGAGGHSAYGAVRKLMAHTLQIGIKAAFCLDVGVTDKIAHLRFFPAKNTDFAHGTLRTKQIVESRVPAPHKLCKQKMKGENPGFPLSNLLQKEINTCRPCHPCRPCHHRA